MTIENTATRARESGNGSKTDFDFQFKIFSKSDINVYKIDASGDATLQVVDSDYTVSYDTDNETGTVAYTVAPTSSETSLIVLSLAYTQGVDLPVDGGMPEKQVENALDRLTLISQQLEDMGDRAVKLSETSEITEVVLQDEPDIGKGLYWVTSGAIGNTSSNIDTLLSDCEDAKDDAIVAQLAAETAQTNAEAAETNAANSATDAENWAASVNLPNLSGAVVGQGIKVNAGKTAYEFTDLDSDTNKIEDADGDTYIDVEKTSDDDTIVGYNAGVKTLEITDEGVVSMLKQSATKMYSTSTQTIAASSGLVKVTILDTDEFDNQSESDTSNHKITVKEDGKYYINFQGQLQDLADQVVFRCAIYINGVYKLFNNIVGSGTTGAYISIDGVFDLSASDYIEIYVQNYDSGSSHNLIGQSYNTNLTVHKLS